MDAIDNNLDYLIEELQQSMRDMEPGTEEYGDAVEQLDTLLNHREAQYKNEATAVENAERLEFDRNKFEKEAKLTKKKTLVDAGGHVLRFLGTVVIAGTSLYQVFTGYKLEYDEHNPISIPGKITSFILKPKG